MITNKVKMITAVSGVLGVLLLGYQISDRIYQNGYNKAVSDIQTEHNKLLQAQRQQAEQKLAEALDVITQDHKDELNRVKSSQQVSIEIQKVKEYVYKEIEIPVGCNTLANNFVSLRSKATSIINSSADRDTGTSVQP